LETDDSAIAVADKLETNPLTLEAELPKLRRGRVDDLIKCNIDVVGIAWRGSSPSRPLQGVKHIRRQGVQPKRTGHGVEKKSVPSVEVESGTERVKGDVGQRTNRSVAWHGPDRVNTDRALSDLPSKARERFDKARCTEIHCIHPPKVDAFIGCHMILLSGYMFHFKHNLRKNPRRAVLPR
jgi:hypothetical protein